MMASGADVMGSCFYVFVDETGEAGRGVRVVAVGWAAERRDAPCARVARPISNV